MALCEALRNSKRSNPPQPSTGAQIHWDGGLSGTGLVGSTEAVQKGRASDYGLLRLIQRLAAHTLASGVKIQLRWIPSERNAADTGSRAWEPWSSKEHAPRAKVAYREGHLSSKEEDRGFHQDGVGEGQRSYGCTRPELGDHGDYRAEEAKEVAFSSGGGSGKRAGAAWDQMLVEGYTEEERESPHTATQVCKEASRRFGWPQAPGDGEREGGDQKGLLEQAERFLRLRQLPRPQHPGRSRPGRSAVRLRGRPVPGWRELQLRSKALGKSRVCPSGGGESWKAAAATLQEESEGLAAAGSHPDTSSDAAAYSSTSASGRWRCSTRWVSRPTRVRGSSCV